MRRYQAIEAVAGALTGRELVISANGMTSRELFSIRESANNFYMLGSMGLGSSIGFGLARSLPDRKVVIIDGDGNVLMNLGSLATIGHFAPNNLIHIVLDNEMHASTGGQPTVSNTLKLEEVARAAGFRRVKKVASTEDLRLALGEAITAGELLSILDEYKKRRAVFEEEIKQKIGHILSDKKARIGLYGAGMHTIQLLGLVNFLDRISCFFDSDPAKQGTMFLDRPVHPPEDITGQGLNTILISSGDYQDEIYRTIRHVERYGIKLIKLYPDGTI